MTFFYLPEGRDDWKNELNNKKIFFEKDAAQYSPYRHYLQSRKWKAKRKMKLKQAGWRCELCGIVHQKGVVLDVHHLTYARATEERMSDLQVLCRDCHKKQHGS